MTELLDADEMAKWIAWKAATDAVMSAVVRDIGVVTGLSSADFSVLTRVVEVGGGRLRQQQLSDDLGWERSRLSRQIGRMEARGLVERTGTVAERFVTATVHGAEVVAEARRAHAAAVRSSLLSLAPATASFWNAVGRVGGAPSARR